MIFPENFEQKIGFSDIRTQLKGRCMSTLGTDWVDNQLQFQTEPSSIREALQRAEEFSRFTEEEEDIYEEHFFDVRQPLLRIRPERTLLEEIELFDLKRSLATVHALTSHFTREGDEGTASYPALARMAGDVAAFPDVVLRIESVLNKYGKIKDTATPELLSIRHSIEVTSRSISHNLRQIITEAQADGYIDRDVAPTLRDGRLVIPVAPALKRKIQGIIHDESATGKTVFIEPAAVVEANNRIRELKAAERREIMRILQELTALIRPHATDMLESLRFLAHIDYLRALTNFSNTFNCVVPTLQETPAIDWVQATHPILQQALRRNGESQVPLDISLREGEKILLISGPNAGGKSVCLKTVGLLQYMMQCGMPVPMQENSTMGIFEDIFISIGDEQSLENSLSTYSSHLLGLKAMMKYSNTRSLLLIDEFGGGTEPQIGGALAEAILDRFVQNQTHGIITTHYQNLKHYAEQCPSVVNGAMLYDRAQMQPLFLLRIGHPGSSFAIEIARKIGLPEEVISYAADLVGKDYVMSDKYLQDIARDKMYWENKRAKVHTQEKRLEQTLASYEREMEELAQERKKVMAQAKAEAQELLRESNAKIENTIRAIREAQAEKERTRAVRQELSQYNESLTQNDAQKSDIERKMEKVRRRQERKQQQRTLSAPGNTGPHEENIPTSTHMAPTHQFQIGDYVQLNGQSTIGRIQSMDGKNAKVLFGMMHTNVSLDRLCPAEAPKHDSISKVSTFVSRETRNAIYEKKLQFKPEIDLRGMRADEALNTTAHFIDDAILLEQTRVRILHGTGTGALRELVRNYLRTVNGIKNFRDEHIQFGGAGITVVELE